MMSNDGKNRETVIPVSLIRETVMPPYEYQKPQNGFGSTSAELPLTAEKTSEESRASAEEE